VLASGRVVVRWTVLGPRDDEHAAGHRLVRHAVGEVLGRSPVDVAVGQVCGRCGGPHGRPVVSVVGRPGPDVSVAHAGGVVVAAVADGAVGIDVEPLDQELRPELVDVVLSAAEQARWPGPGPSADDVLRCWVRKEAVLKSVGLGLDVDPRQVELADSGPPALVRWSGPGRRPSLRLADLDLGPGLVAAVARLGRRAISVDARPAALALPG
jgi:4'-phosphopantetheinyl transferase